MTPAWVTEHGGLLTTADVPILPVSAPLYSILVAEACLALEVIEWTDQTISVEEEHNIGYIQRVIHAVYSASAAQRPGINLTGVRHS